MRIIIKMYHYMLIVILIGLSAIILAGYFIYKEKFLEYQDFLVDSRLVNYRMFLEEYLRHFTDKPKEVAGCIIKKLYNRVGWSKTLEVLNPNLGKTPEIKENNARLFHYYKNICLKSV